MIEARMPPAFSAAASAWAMNGLARWLRVVRVRPGRMRRSSSRFHGASTRKLSSSQNFQRIIAFNKVMAACAPLPRTLLFLDFLPIRPPRTLRLLSCPLNRGRFARLVPHRRFSFPVFKTTLIFPATRLSALAESSGTPCTLPRSSTGCWCCVRAAVRTAEAHFPIGSAGHHHRHSSVVPLCHDTHGHRQDSVLPVILGLHQFSSAEAELHVQILFSWTLIGFTFLDGFLFMHALSEAYGS